MTEHLKRATAVVLVLGSISLGSWALLTPGASPTPHSYFVSFRFASTNGDDGFGHMTLHRSHPITDGNHIMVAREFIMKEYGYTNVVILNWRKFE